jgi:hypothetical protein
MASEPISCPCTPLHFRCNPQTCDKADILKELGNIGGLHSKAADSNCIVTTTLQKLREGGQGGCVTCGILYAGVNHPGSPIPSKWRKHGWNEMDMVAEIESGTGHVYVHHVSRSSGSQRIEQTPKHQDYCFYASPTSSMYKPSDPPCCIIWTQNSIDPLKIRFGGVEPYL